MRFPDLAMQRLALSQRFPTCSRLHHGIFTSIFKPTFLRITFEIFYSDTLDFFKRMYIRVSRILVSLSSRSETSFPYAK